MIGNKSLIVDWCLPDSDNLYCRMCVTFHSCSCPDPGTYYSDPDPPFGHE